MKSRSVRLVLLAIVVVAQLGTIVQMIRAHERVLTDGEAFLFRVAPEDPVDAFRGRYLAIAIAERGAPQGPDTPVRWRRRVFAAVGVGEDGFARISAVTATPPSSGPYFESRMAGGTVDTVFVQIPFDRYYLDEDLAPEAERAYREHASREEANAYVAVRILDGKAVLEELFIDGLPVRNFLARELTRLP